MRTTLDYIQGGGKLNAASSATPGGSTEPVTGIAIPTGTNSGDFIELTDAQALQLSKTSVGTLYSGIFQRVKLDSGVSSVLLGQPLFWLRANTSDPYVVSNATAATYAEDYAGTVIDPATTASQYCWIQVNGRITASLATTGAVGNVVAAPTTGAKQYTAAGTTPLFNGVGLQAGAAAGAANLALVDIRIAQARF